MRPSAKWNQDHDLAFKRPEAEFSSVMLQSGLVEIVCVGQGEPLVLVPGLAGGWQLLAPLAFSLARRHRVIIVGLSGDRGLPLGLARSTPARHAQELATVIDSLRLERPSLFGVSFGGAVALELALQNPGRLRRLVLMGVEARFEGGMAASFLRGILERFPLPRDNAFVNQFFNIFHGQKPAPGPLADFIVGRCWETDQGVISSRLKALESFDVADRLWQLDLPTLVLAGSRDVIVSPENQRTLAESINQARFEPVLGAGHIGFLTHREIVSKLVTRWLRARAGMLH